MTPSDGLLTRAQVLVELEQLTVEAAQRATKWDDAQQDAFDAAANLVRQLAPEGVDVDALAEAVAASWNTDDDIDPSVSTARALILQHVRPVAEPCAGCVRRARDLEYVAAIERLSGTVGPKVFDVVQPLLADFNAHRQPGDLDHTCGLRPSAMEPA